MDKRIPKFLIEEDVIHLKISCQSLRERALLEFSIVPAAGLADKKIIFHTNYSEVDNRRMLHTILNRYTSELS